MHLTDEHHPISVRDTVHSFLMHPIHPSLHLIFDKCLLPCRNNFILTSSNLTIFCLISLVSQSPVSMFLMDSSLSNLFHLCFAFTIFIPLQNLSLLHISILAQYPLTRFKIPLLAASTYVVGPPGLIRPGAATRGRKSTPLDRVLRSTIRREIIQCVGKPWGAEPDGTAQRESTDSTPFQLPSFIPRKSPPITQNTSKEYKYSIFIIIIHHLFILPQISHYTY
jgi:hypothetical protein